MDKDSANDDMLDMIDVGWKALSDDVFRVPKHRIFIAAVVGTGYQLLTICVLLLVLGTVQIVNVNKRSEMYAFAAYAYGFTSAIAGYASARQYRRFGGENWIWNINLTSLIFVLPLFIIWAVVNTCWWIGGSTRALPYTTVIMLAALWLCFGYPLTLIGAIIGRRWEASSGSTFSPPCRTRLVPRELPVLLWYQHPIIHCAISGLLSFSSISVELYYILATIWGREQYTLVYIVLISALILLAVTAATSVAVTYFQLQYEDYRWPWRAIASGASTGVYVFAYAIYFYVERSDMSGLLQTLQYFGYSALLSYAISLALAAVSFLATRKFIFYIYSNVKTD